MDSRQTIRPRHRAIDRRSDAGSYARRAMEIPAEGRRRRAEANPGLQDAET